MDELVELNPDRVHELYHACQRDDGEVTVDGIMRQVSFSTAALEQHQMEIVSLLGELPEQFHVKTGGGWSFLNACYDRHGNLWTGLHLIVEELMTLGLAIGRVRYVLPREMWSVMPGEMPYFVVTDEGGGHHGG